MNNNKFNTNMKKTVFEGVINGQVYNNVKEYNDVITTMIAKGEAFEASTSTKTIDVCDNCESEKCTCGTCCEAPVIDLYFGFDDDLPVADKFLDVDEDNDTTISLIEEQMETNLDGISSAIKRMSISELNAYLKDVNTIISSLKDADANNDKAIDQLEARLCFLMDSSNLHSVFIDYYNNINSMIVDKVSELANDNCKSNCNINTTIKEKTPQVETDFATAFGKIFGEVFKGVDVNALNKLLNGK